MGVTATKAQGVPSVERATDGLDARLYEAVFFAYLNDSVSIYTTIFSLELVVC